MKIQPLSLEEISQIRRETKGIEQKIHFNNAGASMPPNSVVETVVNYLWEEAEMGGYETEFKYREELENTYFLIAQLIHARKEEITLVENASMAWGIAFHGINWKKGDQVIISELEYTSNVLGFLNVKNTFGIELIRIDNQENGKFPLEKLEKAINSKTKLIAVTHIGSSTGGILPIHQIGKIAKKSGIPYLVDACQTIGQIPVNVQEIGCDFLSVTGRKFLRAPRGTGFLFIRQEIQDQIRPIFLDGHSVDWMEEDRYRLRSDAKRFELYEKNRGLILGLGKAVEYAMGIGLERIWERVQILSSALRILLEKNERIKVQDLGDEKSGIVTFTVLGWDSSELKKLLFDRNIQVSVGNTESAPFFMHKNKLNTVIRASVHYMNTLEEVERFMEVLKEIISQEPNIASAK